MAPLRNPFDGKKPCGLIVSFNRGNRKVWKRNPTQNHLRPHCVGDGAESTDSAKNAVRFAWLNRSMNLCIYSLIDIGIHYRGWDAARTAVFLKAFGINNASTAAEIYQYIVETPGNYLKYYWGYLNFLDLKTVCQKRLGDDFDLKEFHRRILDIGPVQFPVLEKYMK